MGTALLFPIADRIWPVIPAFVPGYQTAIILCYAVSAYLIYSHYCVARSTALLYLGAGCFFTSVVLLVQFLSFPGMFVDKVSLVGGPQTTIWLWCFWHVGPAVGIFLYAWSAWRSTDTVPEKDGSRVARVGVGLLTVFALTIGLVTGFPEWLPVLDVRGDFRRMTFLGVAPAIQGMTMAAFLLLWWTTRFRTVLHVWLGVALFALLFDNAITMMGGARLSVGWYVGRLNAFVSAAALLLIYLREFKWVYLRTAGYAGQLEKVNAQLEAEIMERAQQQEALRRSEALLRQLGEHQDTVKELERKHIAQEIHDELGQNMLALRLDLVSLHQELERSKPELMAKTASALNCIDTTVKSVRAIMNDLRPSVLDLGLLAAIEWQTAQFKRHSGISCRLIADEQKLEELKMADKNITAIFRTLQESLTNVLMHASASLVIVEIGVQEGMVSVSIKDDGCGFDQYDQQTPRGFGLIGMQERLTQLGGGVTVDSTLGGGTKVTAQVPILAVAKPAPAASEQAAPSVLNSLA